MGPHSARVQMLTEKRVKRILHEWPSFVRVRARAIDAVSRMTPPRPHQSVVRRDSAQRRRSRSRNRTPDTGVQLGPARTELPFPQVLRWITCRVGLVSERCAHCRTHGGTIAFAPCEHPIFSERRNANRKAPCREGCRPAQGGCSECCLRFVWGQARVSGGDFRWQTRSGGAVHKCSG